MAKDVYCTVDTCLYNKECKCDASQIKVNTCNCNSAKDIKETECETFKCK